jgi:hypothetical protein
MTRWRIAEAGEDALVARYLELCLQQDRAQLMGETFRFGRIMGEVFAIERELKARDGDRRRALLALLRHGNAEVRLNAAKATLAVAPHVARNALEAIFASKQYPQAAEAGMTMNALDRGEFVPT